MPIPARALPLVFSPDDALAAGYTAGQVHHRIRAGHWRRLAKGCYASGDRLDSLAERPRLRHALAVDGRAAAHPRAGRGEQPVRRVPARCQ